jgi:hypothetical protein
METEKKYVYIYTSSEQTIHNLVNKLRTTGHHCRTLTEVKLDDIEARLERTPRKSLKHLPQEIINTRTELKKNCDQIANIPAQQFQRVNQNLFRRCEECIRVTAQDFQQFL